VLYGVAVVTIRCDNVAALEVVVSLTALFSEITLVCFVDDNV
jgi:hypothetical protein